MKFLHTADWQLGKPFARVADPDKRATLRNQRIAAIHRIGELARKHSAEFVLVAGDIFDSFTANKSTVSAACAAIGKIDVPVLAIPGNHDHGGPGCLWEQDFFLQEQQALAPNFRILLHPEQPIELDTASLFPCPLLRRHEAADPTTWLRTVELESQKPRLVLAHGSTQGFNSTAADDEDSALGSPNLIALDRLPADTFDYIALGDWHGTKEITPFAWYSGTPETDRFPKGENNDPGNILLVEAERGKTPTVEKIPTGHIGWHGLTWHFANDDEVDSLDTHLTQATEQSAGRDLVQLTLTGTLGIAAAAKLDTLLETWESRLLRLKRYDRTRIAPSDEEAAALAERAEDPLLSEVATTLLAESQSEGENAEIARIALRELYTATTS